MLRTRDERLQHWQGLPILPLPVNAKVRQGEIPGRGNAEELEREITRHVDSLLVNPENIRKQLDAAIAAETMRNPDEHAIEWLRIIEECDSKRTNYQGQQAAGYMTMGN